MIPVRSAECGVRNAECGRRFYLPNLTHSKTLPLDSFCR
jgi:hypothetical protein